MSEGGRPPYEPSDKEREQVQMLAACGIPQEDIARLIGVAPKTLRKYFREELDMGTVKANAKIAGMLFKKASQGNMTAMIFWLKTRARWATKQEVDVRDMPTDFDDLDLENMSDEQLRQLGNIARQLKNSDSESESD